MLTYKQKLCLLNRRYGDFEQRVLTVLARESSSDDFWLLVDLELLIMYLVQDGLLIDTGQTRPIGKSKSGMVQKLFKITPKGREYIAQCVPLDEPARATHTD